MQHGTTQLFAENVREEIRMSLKNRSDEPDRILQNYHLDHLETVHPFVLSGGQKQRLVAKQLHHLTMQKKTILVITHDLEFIQHACSRVIRLDKGCITCDQPVMLPLDDVRNG